MDRGPGGEASLNEAAELQLASARFPVIISGGGVVMAGDVEMSFGNCGYALPTIIGAKVAAPHRPAIAYAGDGAWGRSLMETMTAVRHNIPVTAVVFHNRQWGAEKTNQVDFYNRRFVAGDLESESFAGIDAGASRSSPPRVPRPRPRGARPRWPAKARSVRS